MLAHLSQKNNHPELALLAAEGGLQRGGRSTSPSRWRPPDGTDWIRVRALREPGEDEASPPSQLRLF